jgi:sugar lactone lactonase YvrE
MSIHSLGSAVRKLAGASVAALALGLVLSLGACGGGGDANAGASTGGGTDTTGGGAGAGTGTGDPAQSPLAISALVPSHGLAGSVVTLTGTGFSTDPAQDTVVLNNKRCAVDSATATELKVEVPAQAGSGPFEVTVGSHQPTVQSPTFTYDLTGVTVSTLAGERLGSQDGIGTEAQFHSPSGVVLDPNGLLFVADSSNHRLRIVGTAGAVNTFAGSSEGDADGAGPLAQFSAPDGLAFDPDLNLVVADFGNNAIRKVSPTGLVTTLVPAAAGLSGPVGVAFDRDGNLYIADQGNHRIVKIDVHGVFTTLAGGTPGSADGTGTAAQFQFPAGLALCGDVLFVADEDNNEIRKVTLDGVVTTYAGATAGLSFADGSRTEARFLAPRHVACDQEGKLFVVDTGNERIRMITPAGIVTTLAGSVAPGFADGDGASARFSLPQQIAVRPGGTLLLSDAANNRIRQIDWR